MASAVGAGLYQASVARQARRSINATASSVSASLGTQLQRDGDLTAAARTLYETTPELTNPGFAAWWSAMGVAERYPETHGFGIVQPVTPAELPAFIAKSAEDALVTPGVPVLPFALTPPGPRARYCIGRIGASTAGLGPAFEPGYDLCAIPAFASALWLAADSGNPVVLPISGNTFGMIIPVYRPGSMLAAVADRRSALVAWTGGLFDAGPLLTRAANGQGDLSVALYRQNPSSGPLLVAASAKGRSAHRLEHTVTVQADGQWLIRVSAAASYGALSPNLQGLALLAVGVALSLLLFLLVIVLVGSRRRALTLVHDKTVELQHQALHDALTGLPNRALILDRLEQALARTRRQHTAVSAMFIDLDNFKDINDTFGHAAGDGLLQDLAARLSGVVRDTDTVGRLGGDEFVVLAEGASLDAGPEVLAERLLDVLREPFLVGAVERFAYAVSGSVGVANGDRASAAELLRDADVALYEAKALGKNRYVVFQPAMQTAVQDRLEMEMDLRRAVDEGQLFVVYQPTFDRRHETITGVEALLRWKHPSRGVLRPDTFTALAEETGMIGEIDQWVLREATRQTSAWRAEGHLLNVAVKVSSRQLGTVELVAEVGAALARSGLDPASLTLGITETAIMTDVTETAGQLAALKTLGIRIAIDDFGTGYSTLANLHRFPIDVLKINRSLIAGVASPSDAAALVSALVELGGILGIEVVSDGVDGALEAGPFESTAIPALLATWTAGVATT